VMEDMTNQDEAVSVGIVASVLYLKVLQKDLHL
jgi:hypothetical protein